ncbi:hypothetical protein [Phytomonospora endophytica]|uniref:Uncharacterized protein n=1 Tax=Phytomonospora endophytica TaxID=714109 RepID=A0A841FQD4_9ACTN|nr:hypothetical protein [Phytomonospora endophytica]MBB6034170.1 hypothetical protein [Phytomonospora endophytica]GIG66562.1 hypothetical protein Pen01_28570 [Phytomonospora endophytica]
MPVGDRVQEGPSLGFEEFTEKLRKLTVRALSPDRSVRAILDSTGKRVEFGYDGSGGHTERTLGEQVTAALQAIEQGYQRAMSILLSHATGEPEPLAGTPVLDARGRAYAQRVGGIDVRVESPRGAVAIRRSARPSGTEVRIRPNTLGGLGMSDEQLVGELNAAIAAADSEYERRFSAVQEQYRWEARG